MEAGQRSNHHSTPHPTTQPQFESMLRVGTFEEHLTKPQTCVREVYVYTPVSTALLQTSNRKAHSV